MIRKSSNSSGCSAVRLAHHVRDVGVAGSNPVTPTKRPSAVAFFDLNQLRTSRWRFESSVSGDHESLWAWFDGTINPVNTTRNHDLGGFLFNTLVISI